MRRRAAFISLGISLVLSCAAMAQQWEVGGAGGFGLYRNANVANATGSATAGFAAELAGGIVIGENLYRHLGGEFRYTYRDGDLKLQSAGQEASMEGRAHAVHYDFLMHAARRGSKLRPFVAAGAGIKVYQGTGKESAFQPLSRFALLTRTDQVEPLISFGGGVKYLISRHAMFRADIRDYVTPAPDRLFTPAPGAKLHGWLHDVVPLVGLSYVF